MRYIVIARDGTDPEAKARRLAVRPAHLERVAPFVERGRVLIGGAILDDAGDMVGSVLLTDFSGREEVEAWVADDPVRHGRGLEADRGLGLPAGRRRLASGRLTPNADCRRTDAAGERIRPG